MKRGENEQKLASERKNRPSNWIRSVAWGISLGAAIGLLPEASILWLFALVVVFFLPVSLIALFSSLVLFSLVSPNFEPFFQDVGNWVFLFPAVEKMAVSLNNLPVVAWFGLTNSGVLGSVVISCVAILPVAVILKAILRKSVGLFAANDNNSLAVVAASEGNH